jgi:hypothetical protein
MGDARDTRKIHKEIWSEYLKTIDHSVDLVVDGRIKLE